MDELKLLLQPPPAVTLFVSLDRQGQNPLLNRRPDVWPAMPRRHRRNVIDLACSTLALLSLSASRGPRPGPGPGLVVDTVDVNVSVRSVLQRQDGMPLSEPTGDGAVDGRADEVERLGDTATQEAVEQAVVEAGEQRRREGARRQQGVRLGFACSR